MEEGMQNVPCSRSSPNTEKVVADFGRAIPRSGFPFGSITTSASKRAGHFPVDFRRFSPLILALLRSIQRWTDSDGEITDSLAKCRGAGLIATASEHSKTCP